MHVTCGTLPIASSISDGSMTCLTVITQVQCTLGPSQMYVVHVSSCQEMASVLYTSCWKQERGCQGTDANLHPGLVMEVGHIELLARCMRQHLVVLLQDFVKALQQQTPQAWRCSWFHSQPLQGSFPYCSGTHQLGLCLMPWMGLSGGTC